MISWFARKGPFNATLPGGKTLTVKAGDNLLKAALEAGIAWPHNCRVGSCGECRSRLVSGKIKELNDFSYVLSKEELDAGMILACQTALRSDIEVDVKIEQGVELPRARTAPGTITTYRPLTHDIVEIGIRLDEPLPAHLAGQYAELRVPGTIDQPRSYSYARAQIERVEANEVNFFVRLVPNGQMTTWLHEKDRTNARIEVCGPHGNFWLRQSSKPALFICGGSGLAPIKALLEQVASEGFERDVTLVFGARSQRDLYCEEDLLSIAAPAGSRFRFLPILSEEPDDSGWSGLRGLCTEIIEAEIDQALGCEAYLCGPPGMIDAAIAELNKAGISNDDIYFDKFLDASHMPNGRVVNA